MGGRIALLASIDNAGTFNAVCPFYGPLADVDPAKEQTPVCGSYGARDTGIPADSVRAFAAALHVPNDIKIYDNAGHAFMDDQRASYVASAAADAWTRTLAFLDKISRTAERVIEVVAGALSLFLFGAAIGAAIAWLAARAESAALRATLHESSRSGEKAIEALLERAKNELREATALRASERVGELVSPVAAKLVEFDRLINEMEATRRRDEGSLREQLDQLLGRTDKLQSATSHLSTQTLTLVTALRNPTSRGKWGEMQLRNVVEKAGMLSHCDFTEQQTVVLEEARVRPDMTINLPGERRVFVDAKAPIDAMQAALEAPDEDARRALVKQHARALRDHIDSLARRGYQTAKGSADYVVMFVAGEVFLSSACSEDPSIIEYALDKGVLVAGPLSLISLLRTFAMGWQALRQEENAKRIAAIGRVLYERTVKFSEHLLEVRKHLERSVNAFNGAAGSYESKLLPQGRKLKDEASLIGEDLDAIPPIDVVPRDLTSLDTHATTKRCLARRSSSSTTTRCSRRFGAVTLRLGHIRRATSVWPSYRLPRASRIHAPALGQTVLVRA